MQICRIHGCKYEIVLSTFNFHHQLKCLKTFSINVFFWQQWSSIEESLHIVTLPFLVRLLKKTVRQTDWPTDGSDHKKENKQVSEPSEIWEEGMLSVE